MRKILFMLLLTSGASVFAASGTSTSTSGTAGAPTNTVGTASTASGSASTNMDTPTAACKSMVESAKSKNFDAFMKMTTDMPMHEKKNIASTKGKFQKMQGQYMDRLQDLSCGNETIAQDHAIVESESKGEKRLVPFVKTNDGWKFDMRTYQSFYHTEAHEKGGKNM